MRRRWQQRRRGRRRRLPGRTPPAARGSEVAHHEPGGRADEQPPRPRPAAPGVLEAGGAVRVQVHAGLHAAHAGPEVRVLDLQQWRPPVHPLDRVQRTDGAAPAGLAADEQPAHQRRGQERAHTAAVAGPLRSSRSLRATIRATKATAAAVNPCAAIPPGAGLPRDRPVSRGSWLTSANGQTLRQTRGRPGTTAGAPTPRPPRSAPAPPPVARPA
jgi:hypothetical protein